MKWRFIFLTCCLVFLAPRAFNQIWIPPSEMVEAVRDGDNKLILGFDTRRSFISNQNVRLFGIKCGLDFDTKIRLGFGVYFLANPFKRTLVIPEADSVRIVNAQLRFAYVSLFAQPVWLSTRRWEISSPFHLGIGESYYQGPGSIIALETNRTVLLAELSATIQYKIVPWIGLGAGFGYRQMILGNAFVREDFNAPVYSLGIKLFLGYLYNKYFRE